MRTKNQDEGHLVLTVIIENEAIDTIENAVIAEKGEEGVHHLIDTDITVLTGTVTVTVIVTTIVIEAVTTIETETVTEEIDAENHPATTAVETAETKTATAADSKPIYSPIYLLFLSLLIVVPPPPTRTTTETIENTETTKKGAAAALAKETVTDVTAEKKKTCIPTSRKKRMLTYCLTWTSTAMNCSGMVFNGLVKHSGSWLARILIHCCRKLIRKFKKFLGLINKLI